MVHRHPIGLLHPVLEPEVEQRRLTDDIALTRIALDTGNDSGIDQGLGEGRVA